MPTKIVEYGTYSDEEQSITTTLAEAPMKLQPHRTARLVHQSSGYVPAGSVARWDDELWAVRWVDQFDGATYGRRYTNEPEARAYFTRLTTEGSS